MSCFVTVRFFLLKVTINRQLKFKLIFGLSATPTNRQSLLSAIYFVQNENCNSRNSVVTAIYLHSYIQRVYTYISYAHCCAVRPFPQSPFHVIRFLAVSWDFFPRCAIKLRISFCFALFFRRVLDFLSRVNTKTRIARAWRCFFRAFLFYVYIYIYESPIGLHVKIFVSNAGPCFFRSVSHNQHAILWLLRHPSCIRIIYVQYVLSAVSTHCQQPYHCPTIPDPSNTLLTAP